MIEIYNTDCIEYLQSIEDKSIDLILTDPPYGISYQSNGRVKSDKFNVLKNDDNDSRFLSYPEFYRVLKDNSACIIFASWKNFAMDYVELEKLFHIKNVIIWYKHGSGLGDLKHSLSTDFEMAIVCHKGKCRIRGKREGSVWEVGKVNPNKMVHPTQKPVELIEKLIQKYSDEGMTVLDTYMGSGSTAIACKNTNRSFIGCELDSNYFNIAKQRIEQAK